MLVDIIVAIIGAGLYLIPGYLTNLLIRKKEQTWLLQLGLSLGFAILISTATGLILGFIGIFSRLIFLISLAVISAALYWTLEAKRYKAKNSTKK